MAIAQRMGRAVPPPVLVVILLVALVIGASALMFTWISAPAPSTVPYSQFLTDVEGGSVTSVTQIGTTLEVSGPHGDYTATIPTVLTDVYADVEQAAGAAGAPVPLFQAQPAPDSSWIGVVLTALLPFAVVLVGVALVLLLVVRPARRGHARGLSDRLREVDEAYRAGLITDDEHVRQRARILDES